MDPLSVLRDYNIHNNLSAVTRTDSTYHFSSAYSFPASSPTSFRSKQGTFYSLETLIFFLLHHSDKHTDYLQSSRLHRIPPVTLPDRKPLLDYLSGLIPSPDNIDRLPPSQSPLPPDTVPPSLPVDNLPLLLLRSREIPLKTRDSILESRNRDFYSVILSSTRREEERQSMELSQRKDEIVAKTRIAGGGDEVGEGVPIILVPSASQTLVTIYNVKEFLEDGVFVASEERVRRGGGRPECVTVQKRLGRDRVVAAYEVRDKTVGFKAEDWERVVAVFVLGKEWQFKDWPFRNHVEIFNKSELVNVFDDFGCLNAKS